MAVLNAAFGGIPLGVSGLHLNRELVNIRVMETF